MWSIAHLRKISGDGVRSGRSALVKANPTAFVLEPALLRFVVEGAAEEYHAARN